MPRRGKGPMEWTAYIDGYGWLSIMAAVAWLLMVLSFLAWRL